MEQKNLKTKQQTIVVQKYKELLKSGRPYYKKGDTQLLRKALIYISDHYQSEDHFCGEPLILASLDIALSLTKEIGLGTPSIIVALLHPALENGSLKAQDIHDQFGPRIGQLAFADEAHLKIDIRHLSLESENFRKLLIRLTKDVRTLLIRMAITLYELRHFNNLSLGDQDFCLRKARSVFIPFAHRLGLYHIKTELEETLMRITQPDDYNDISRKLSQTSKIQESFIQEVIKNIEKPLREAALIFEVKSRYKSVHSIWKKMKAQGVDVSGVFDLFAIRIILDAPHSDEKAICWQAYSIVSDIYKPDPKRLRDWISAPKASGYESLHTTVKTEDGRWIEVQIRSKRMDDIAENGSAAHWRYKEHKGLKDEDSWLGNIRKRLETPDSFESDDENINAQNVYEESIFVFTPNGDIQKLPLGASVLDFAFSLHSKLGETCMGAKVNGKMVPIKYKPENGDQIDIITSKNQKPGKDWLNFVITKRAKNRIRRCLREEIMLEADRGKEILLRKLKNWKIPYKDELIEKLLQHYKIKTAVELYAKIASSELDHLHIKHLLTETTQIKTLPETATTIVEEKINKKQHKRENHEDVILVGQDSRNMNYHFAKCCNPLPGDKIFGFVRVNNGISIHREQCPNAAEMKRKYAYRLVNMAWQGENGNEAYKVSIHLHGFDRLGLLNDVTDLITKELRVNLISVSIGALEGEMDGKLEIQVFSKEKANEIIRKLEKIKGISKARRLGNMA